MFFARALFDHSLFDIGKMGQRDRKIEKQLSLKLKEKFKH
jgi:hypothetical protein